MKHGALPVPRITLPFSAATSLFALDSVSSIQSQQVGRNRMVLKVAIQDPLKPHGRLSLKKNY